MSSPMVSIIMPTFDQADFIDEALNSVVRQNFYDWELIVVNDGCTDDTAKILDHWKGVIEVIVEHPENLGTAKAINSGIEHAKGKLWTWISSDNTMAQAWLKTLVEAMKLNPQLGAIYSGFDYCEPMAQPRYLFKSYSPSSLINDPNCFIGPAFLIEADIWKKAGPHRGKISHDYDHWLRVEEECLRKRKRIAGLDVALCSYNAHPKRATVTRKHEYDAKYWQAEARKRRGR